jgi:periplasmic protein TonB
MAYADQSSMSGNKITAIIIVAAIHVFVGYALVSGLAYEAAKKVVKTVTTVDIEEPEPPKEEPPPPEPEPVQDTAPPPPVAPPVKINVQTKPPQIQTVQTPPPPAPVIAIAAPPAPVIAPPPPAPKGPTTSAKPRNNPGSWATDADYPSRAQRDEAQGTTGFRVTVNAEGRVSSCVVTSSSGNSELDEATCKLVTRRARFTPAQRNGEKVEDTYSNRITWRIPE